MLIHANDTNNTNFDPMYIGIICIIRILVSRIILVSAYASGFYKSRAPVSRDG